MRVIGSMIFDMEEDMKDIRMAMFIWVILKLEKLMAKDTIHGSILGKFMMGNGLEEYDTVTECGKIKKENHIWVSGEMVKQ